MTVLTTRYRSRTEEEPEPVPRAEPVVWGDPDAGPLDPTTVEEFDRRGFFTMDRIVDQWRIEALEAELCDLALDPRFEGDERLVREPASQEVRSIFEVHRLSEQVHDVATDPAVLGPVRQILGSEVYLHQSRVNFKPGLRGKEFYWHSDFETWHFEDGLPAMRTVSVSIAFTENSPVNGGLMIMPGSHRTFVGCVGATPEHHYRQSLRAQHYGVPSDRAVTRLAVAHGIEMVTGPVGSAVFFDCNCMHGSNGNITPFPRSNLFLVFNSVDNEVVEPFGGTDPRPEFVAARRVEPLVDRSTSTAR
jgi:ectoine hydroxylase